MGDAMMLIYSIFLACYEYVMRQIILKSPKELTSQEVSDPVPAPNELLIKIHTAFTCGTTLKTFLRGHPKIPFNSPFGHEFSGTVIGTAPDEQHYKTGDRVVALHSYPCEQCFYCLNARPNLCENFSSHLNLGAFADKILLPEPIVRRYCFRIPESVSFERAAFLQSTSCVVHAIRKLSLDLETGKMVAIVGSGSFGLLMGMVLATMGHIPVFKIRNESKVQLLTQLGFKYGADRQAVERWFPSHKIMHVVEAAGQKASWEEAFSLISHGGKLLWFGGMAGSEEFILDHHKMHYGEIEAFGAFHYVPEDVRKAKDLLFDTLDPTCLLSGHLPLSELELAFNYMQQGKGQKYAVHP